MIGQTISHYRILEKLGEGGMGEVYLAQDTGPLDRKVALKFPSHEMQQDPVARQRFLREAKSAAALDHPYVCHIHEVGEDGDRSFISMEYVAGQSLKERLANGPLEMKDALQKATEIAEALEAAHKQNIVHRDLKPANIMLTPEGHVKVMDFGLAKRLTDDEKGGQETTLTRTGSTLGTLPYMSPEQVRGQAVDTRSDIFSFGVALYEMLPGVHPFKKDTPVETANAILKEVPAAVTRHLDNTPLLLQHTVRKMLAKEPDRRYQLAHDVRTDLGDLIISDIADSGETQVETASVPATVQESGAPSVWRWAILGGAIGLVLGVAGLLLWGLGHYSQPPQSKVTRFSISLPDDETVPPQASLALFPDGSQLVYAAVRDSTRRLYLRATDQLEAKPIPGTEGGWSPFFSPDGKWVGFFTAPQGKNELKKWSLLGGEPLTVCQAAGRQGSWGKDGRIIFGSREGLWRVSSTGGTPELLIPDGKFYSPQILPGGRAVLFSLTPFGRTPSLGVVSLDTGQQSILVDGGSQGHYLPTGHLIYAQGGSVLAAPFDLDSLELRGPGIPAVDGLWLVSGLPRFEVSRSGSLAYVPGLDVGREDTPVWVDHDGVEEPFLETQMELYAPRLSPDGKRLVVVARKGASHHIWGCEIERCALSPLPYEGAFAPVWSRGGAEVFFAGMGNMWRIPADGSGGHERVLEKEYDQHPRSCAPDGTVLAFVESKEDDAGIFTMRLDGEAKVEPFHVTQFYENHPVFSPDGNWIAFNSNRSGRDEIYVKRYPSKGGLIPITTEGGTRPLWSPDGKEIFYNDGAKMMAVSVQRQPSLKAGKARGILPLLSPGFQGKSGRMRIEYDLTPDGRRFLMVKRGEVSLPSQIHVVLNWSEELKRLVPTDN